LPMRPRLIAASVPAHTTEDQVVLRSGARPGMDGRSAAG
jgi:hypothetical protein